MKHPPFVTMVDVGYETAYDWNHTMRVFNVNGCAGFDDQETFGSYPINMDIWPREIGLGQRKRTFRWKKCGFSSGELRAELGESRTAQFGCFLIDSQWSYPMITGEKSLFWASSQIVVLMFFHKFAENQLFMMNHHFSISQPASTSISPRPFFTPKGARFLRKLSSSSARMVPMSRSCCRANLGGSKHGQKGPEMGKWGYISWDALEIYFFILDIYIYIYILYIYYIYIYCIYIYTYIMCIYI